MSTPSEPPVHSVRRREFLTWTGAALAGASLGAIPLVSGSQALAADAAPAGRKRSLRLAHMTDMHVQPELAAGEGMAAALKHVQSISDPPELILGGGDMVMDVSEADAARAKAQWDIWQSVLKQECSLPIQHCIGNHDVWGWNKVASKTTSKEPGWGKQQAIDKLGLSGRYYGFDRGGWRVLVLDSIYADPQNVYIARLDEEQFEWLTAELKRIPAKTPVMLLSHIPILSVAVVEFRQAIEQNPRQSLGATHSDAQRIVRLLKQHPNVKAAISGHLHMTERIEYAGITYLCGGVEGRYVAYGWKARD